MPLTETVQAIGKLFKRSCSDNMNESAPSANVTVTRPGLDPLLWIFSIVSSENW